jgi:surfactin synthase thioesterase subunit
VTTSATSTDKPPWLLRRPDPDADARLFCFPYSGCGASMYHRWPRRAGSIDICRIQPPARESRIRQPHYGTYPDLARSILDGLARYLDKPYAFFGHCGGALPGVELARQIAAAGLPPPRRVFVSSQVAPHNGPAGRMLSLGRAELAEELRALVVRFGGTPSQEFIALSLDVLVADLEANRRYQVPGPQPLPCPVTALGWTDDDEIPMSMMGGWSEVTTECRFVLLDGGHYEFLYAPPALMAEFERGLASDPA